MKLSIILNVILAATVVGVLIITSGTKSEETSIQFEDTVKVNETLNTIHQRKSVRSFTSEKVSREQLEILVRAGMAAPTAVNMQPWAFIAIDDRALLNKLGDNLPYAKMIYEATSAIVVCGDTNKTLEGEGQEYWIQDCSAATENILLAAESMGLGAVWTSAYPGDERIKAAKEILNLPENFIPLCVIPVGYPKGEQTPKDKWKESNMFWNQLD